VKIVSDILMAFYHGDIAALALLDCSVAFDTVYHDILLRKLSESFCMDDTALQWLTFYLRGRLQCGRYGDRQSELQTCQLWCPQGPPLIAKFLGHHCSSSSTQLNSARWSMLNICIHTNTLTMYRHLAGDNKQNQTL